MPRVGHATSTSILQKEIAGLYKWCASSVCDRVHTTIEPKQQVRCSFHKASMHRAPGVHFILPDAFNVYARQKCTNVQSIRTWNRGDVQLSSVHTRRSLRECLTRTCVFHCHRRVCAYCDDTDVRVLHDTDVYVLRCHGCVCATRYGRIKSGSWKRL